MEDDNGQEVERSGRVVLQDGKIIFIRNGPRLIRTSANRTVKVGEEFGKKEEIGNGLGDREAIEPMNGDSAEAEKEVDMGELWEDTLGETSASQMQSGQEGGPNWESRDARVIEENTELITDVPKVATSEGNSLEEETGGGPQGDKLLEAPHLPQLVARNQGALIEDGEETVGPWDNLQETPEENSVDASEEV